MIDENFINACFYKVYNKYDTSMKNKKSYLSLKNLIKENKDPNINIDNKTSLLLNMLDYSIKGVPVEDILNQIIWTGKYKDIYDFVNFKIEERLDDVAVNIINERMKVTRTNLIINDSILKFNDFFARYQNGSFNTKDEQQKAFNEFHNDLNKKIKLENREIKNIESGGYDSLDSDGTLDNVFDKFVARCDYTNKIPSGFNLIDTRVLRGGFEKTRLYCFAGQAKSGKSTMLNTIFNNASLINYSTRENYDGKSKIFVLITLENVEEEVFSRCYSNMFNVVEEQVLEKMTAHKDNMKKEWMDKINKQGNISNIHYYHSGSFSVEDLELYLEECVDKYSEIKGNECVIGAVYIDYLNLLGNGGQDDWKGLGNIAKDLKSLCSEGIRSSLNDGSKSTFPIITAAQLKRPDRLITHPSQLDPSQIGESYRIVQIADSTFVMAPSDRDREEVYFNSGTQRNGEGMLPIYFKVNFRTHSFLSCIDSTVEQPNIETGDMKIPEGTKIERIEGVTRIKDVSQFGGMGESF